MIRYGTIVVVCALLLTAPLRAANWRSDVRAGDKAYEHQKYDEALVRYLEALSSKGDSALIRYDLGNVFHAQEKYDEAVRSFQSALSGADSLTQADALYNTGNALFGMQKYQEAAAVYKSALRLKPGQENYLYNLQLAMHLLKKQQQNQQNPSGSQEQKDKQNQQKQDKQQEQQEQQQNQPQEQQPQEKEPDQQEQQRTEQQNQMSREDAERLLNALQKDEMRIQKNLHRQKAVESGVKKDW